MVLILTLFLNFVQRLLQLDCPIAINVLSVSLSSGERAGERIPRMKHPRFEPLNLVTTSAPDTAQDCGTILPLPKGEGRGEGEGDLIVPVESYRKKSGPMVFPPLDKGGLFHQHFHSSVHGEGGRFTDFAQPF